jgi:DNA-binding transcriptional MerR regulator
MSQVMLGEGDAARVGTPPPKRYKIGELARHTGLTRQTLHNYTRWGLIAEAGWTAGGHRLYDASVFPRLARILTLKRDHTVEQVRAMLEADPAGEGVGRGR